MPDRCPSELELTLLADGKLAEQEALALRRHVAGCRACSAVLTTALALQDLAAAHRLPAPAMRDVEQALQRLKPAAESISVTRENNGARQILAELWGMVTVAQNVMDNALGIAPVLGHDADAHLCAIRAEQCILKHCGIDVALEQLVAESTARGWYRPGRGTGLRHLGNLLELHGLTVRKIRQATVADLRRELAAGHPALVTLDYGELEGPGHAKPLHECVEDCLAPRPDHALCVFQVLPGPEHQVVILPDPRHEEQPETIAWERFLDAWADSGCLLVSVPNANGKR